MYKIVMLKQRRVVVAISGIVQGVGFRPYVYRLACQHHLTGYVTNTADGVTIEAEGGPAAIDSFLVRLPVEIPALARVTSLSVNELPCRGDTEFQIIASRAGGQMHVLISPDVATCQDCQRELFDPYDRRYGYPFINCTNCGPRFTIVRDIPYDRPSTSMGAFPMCRECQTEYDNPADRRFHAQPNACWTCGPQVELWNRDGSQIDVADPIREAADRLSAGQIVAIKGLGGFHLAADGNNEDAVRRLRERKRRWEKPFAVMVPNLDGAAAYCELDGPSSAQLESFARPIVLLRKRTATPLANSVAPSSRTLGVFLPYTPIHHLLLGTGAFSALVMTSGNMSEEPIAIANDEAVIRLGNLADCLLVHNRDILLRCDDSVVRVSGGKPRQLRRSRGFVPVPVFLSQQMPPILAVGGELKNTICVTKGTQAFLSQHIGDLENLEAFHFFQEAIEHLQRILEVRPQILAHDLHPEYLSTRWALEQHGFRTIGVQHHHAHIASVMAENHLDGSVIGFALDGTGYGADQAIWGGEVLIANYAYFERAVHLAYVPMPGGEAAVREPWRMAVAYLGQYFGHEFLNLHPLFVERIGVRRIKTVLQMLERRANSPLTSSCGRLFDAVAAVIGIRDRISYEGQAAIELEMAITEPAREEAAYPLQLVRDCEPWIIVAGSLFESLLDDLRAGVTPSVMSQRFHNGLVDVFAQTADLLREKHQLSRVCLSGGTFQNLYLFERLVHRLKERGFEVFTHAEVPAGDGGLSLGQALVAAHRAIPFTKVPAATASEKGNLFSM
jgi:hydrogenase maturation protein HypF